MGGGPYSRSSGPTLIDEAGVMNKLGVIPKKVIDLKALTGDSSDNIPGIKGVGPKTACKLINQFNSVENILSSSNEISNIRIKGLIEDQIEDIRLSNKLVQLDMNVPIKVDIDSMLINNIDFSEISSDLIGFEMPTLLDSLKIDTGDQILDSSIQSFDTVTSKYHLITTKTQLDELRNDISKQSIVPTPPSKITIPQHMIISSKETYNYIGEQKMVCGYVADTRYALSSKNKPTFLNFDYSFPNQTFTVVIWDLYRNGFNAAPDLLYKNNCFDFVL